MINSSFQEYVLIHIFILFFQYTPLLYTSILLFLTLHNGWPSASSSPLFRLTSTLLVLETIFALTLYRTYVTRLLKAAKHPPPGTRANRRALFEKCFSHVSDVDAYLRLWFLGAEPSEVRRENMREFLLWGFFDRDLKECEEDDEVLGELEEYMTRVEEKLGRKLEPGRGVAECLRLTIDGVECRYRSLTWYLIIFLVDTAAHAVFYLQGFRHYSQSLRKSLRVFPPRISHLVLPAERSVAADLSYWYRPHKSPNKLPIVFLHGIGIGLWTYIQFLSELNSSTKDHDDQIGILAIEILPISFRLAFDEPLASQEFARQVSKILSHHDIHEFVLVAHSYGTVLTTQMLRSPKLAPRIASLVLVDPVSLLLHQPHVAYNFTRRKPRTAGQWQLWYFASMDPGVAYVLGRHFFWRDSIVWKEDLLERNGRDGEENGNGVSEKAWRRVAVFLAERDLIVSAPAVHRYLEAEEDDGCVVVSEGGKVEVTLFPELDHAQVFDSPEDREKVLAVIRAYCCAE